MERKKPSDLSVAIEAAERYGAAQFPGDKAGNALAEMQAELSALRAEAAVRRGREELLREQDDRRLKIRAILVPAVISVLSLLVSIAALAVAIWVARKHS